jgi:hypothetical protein
MMFFFFQKKKQKAFVLLRRILFLPTPSVKQNHGGLEGCPKKTSDVVNSSCGILLFPEKEAKGVCSASQNSLSPHTFREAEPRGFGGLPQKNIRCSQFLLWYSSFSRKRSKKRLFCFAEVSFSPHLPRSGTTGVWGLAPKKTRCSQFLLWYSSFSRKRSKKRLVN